MILLACDGCGGQTIYISKSWRKRFDSVKVEADICGGHPHVAVGIMARVQLLTIGWVQSEVEVIGIKARFDMFSSRVGVNLS
jgi:hypothetical protein